MRKKIRNAVLVLAAAAALTGYAVQAQSVSRIHDLGTAFPAARNLSQSADYAVYKWVLDGGAALYQVNTANGKVLAVVVSGGDQTVTDLKLGKSPVAILAKGVGAQVTPNGSLAPAWLRTPPAPALARRRRSMRMQMSSML
ncbi:MAG: hypothetical protein HY021_11490 [Burkholderiales bacterium]|nr:hypothetical protein [Burkholderiales bacterium]